MNLPVVISEKLNGMPIVYNTHTEFLIQVGKAPGGYKTIHKVVGNLSMALAAFNAIPSVNGVKKRVYAPSLKQKVLARQFSYNYG